MNLNGITPSIAGNFTDPLWTHSAATWLQDMGAQAGLGLIFVAARLGPPAPPRPAPPKGLSHGPGNA